MVTSWPYAEPYGAFAEGLARGADGNLYASLTTWGDEANLGQIVKVSPTTGARTPFGDSFGVGGGLLPGLACDAQGRLYVAVAFSETPGVFRVEPSGPPAQILALPAESFPNGLAFEGRYLYVTDSSLGAIWRTSVDGFAAPSVPWVSDPLLLPGTKPADHGIGANGIAASPGRLVVSVSDAGRIVSLPIAADGSPGPVSVVAERGELRAADGIAFDSAGGLWIVTNGPVKGRLLVLAPNGKLTVAAAQPAWLDYPTMPVFGASGELFIENGSFSGGQPSIVAMR